MMILIGAAYSRQSVAIAIVGFVVDAAVVVCYWCY